MIRAAQQAKVKFIMTPSHLAVRQRETVLTKMYREIEDEVKRSGIPHCFLHSELFMDTYLAEAKEIKKKGTLSCVVNPDAKFNPVSGADIGEVAALILSCPEEREDTRYTITGPRPISMTEMAGMFSKVCFFPFVRFNGFWFLKSLLYLVAPWKRGQVCAGGP